jgi:hypothetical protein
MKKIIAVIVSFAFLVFCGHIPRGYAEERDAVIQKISTLEKAKKIAQVSGGEYWEASEYWKKPPAPDVEGTAKVALPVQDEETGEVIGYIVADREKLVAALKAEGLTEVANALAAAEAGSAAGDAATAGFLSGTTGKVILGIVLVAGIAIAASSGGGGGGGGSTSTPIHP